MNIVGPTVSSNLCKNGQKVKVEVPRRHNQRPVMKERNKIENHKSVMSLHRRVKSQKIRREREKKVANVARDT